MLKKLKAWGHSAGIVITKEQLELHKLKIGDVIELTITKIKKGSVKIDGKNKV